MISILGVLAETYGKAFWIMYHQPNSWIFNIYMIIEFALYCAAAAYYLPAFIRRLLPYIVGLQAIVWLTQIVRFSIFQFANFSLVVGSLILTVLYMVILVTQTMHATRALVKNPLFWLCISVVLYYACDIPAMTKFTTEVEAYVNKNTAEIHVDINQTFSNISCIAICFCFLLTGLQKRRETVTLNIK